MTESRTRSGVVMCVFGILAFAAVWGTVTMSEVIAIASAVLLVVLASVLLVVPDRLSLSGGGITASMERQQRQRIEEVVTATLQGTEVPESRGTPEAVVRPVERSIGGTIPRAELKRFAEALITESAEWGWMMGQIGFKTVPRPVIEWEGDEPRIMAGKGDPAGPRGGRLSGTERPGYDKPNDSGQR